MTSANGRCESEPTPVERAAGRRPERGDQRGHHDRPQPQDRRLAGGLGDAAAAAAQLVGVGDVDHRGLHRDAEQGQEADPGRHRERRAGEPQREEAADRRREQHAEHGDERELEVAVEREQQQEDQAERQRQRSG